MGIPDMVPTLCSLHMRAHPPASIVVPRWLIASG
jgi:hypothetical protein